MLSNNNREDENKAQVREANECGKEVLSRDSTFKLTIAQALDLAFSDYESGNLLRAEQLCRIVLQRVPNHIDAMQLLGVLLNSKGQYAEAEQLLRESIKQAPGHAHLHNSLGMVLNKLGKPQEAVLEFSRSLEIRPDFAKAHNNLGVMLMKLGHMDEAIAACRQAINLQSDFKDAYNNLGLALKKTGELENAIASYQKAINIDPQYPEALSNLGMALIAQGRLKEAAKKLQKVVSLVPDSAEFNNNLGVLFNRQGRSEEAVAMSRKAIALRPDYVEAHNNLGTALMEVGRFSEATDAFKKAISIDPECAEAHHNRALVLLLTGQFEEGWEEYEWRWRHEGFSTPVRPFTQQWWDGSMEGVTKLLIWAEQGIGDEVQFSGLIRHLIQRGIQVVVECDKRLVKLLKRSLTGMIIVARTNPPAALLKDPAITHQIQMGSIPRMLRLSPDSMSFQKPFMIFDKNRRDQFRNEYKGDDNPVLVGISFRSGNNQEGLKRSIGLDQWRPILKVSGTRFVNLQYGECSRQLQAAYERFGVKIFDDTRIDPLKDLESFAAQVAAMDVVISVDNSTVHFAGSLGVETWTMLPSTPDWRWGLKSEKTRWYPTMRLFRQEEKGKWDTVILTVSRELTSLVSRTQ